MPTSVPNSSDYTNAPTEIDVPTSWAERQMAKGLLKLSDEQINQLEVQSRIVLPADLVNPLLNVEQTRTIVWIEALEAVHLLGPSVGGDAAAKSKLIERLRDGAISCTYIWMSEEADIGKVTDERPRRPYVPCLPGFTPWTSDVNDGSRDCFMGGEFWRYSDDWSADVHRWNWQLGLFVASRRWSGSLSVGGSPGGHWRSKFRTRLVVSGIRFSRAEVEKIIEISAWAVDKRISAPEVGAAVGLANKRGRAGPRRKKFNTGPVFAEIESAIYNASLAKELRLSEYGGQARLENIISMKLTGDDGIPPSETTVRRGAKKILEDWLKSF